MIKRDNLAGDTGDKLWVKKEKKISLTEKILELSLKSSSIIKVGDLTIIFMGYVTIAVAILSFGNFISQCQNFFSRNGMRDVFETVRLITSVVKVGFLLFVRIFCLPVVLGTMVMMVANIRTQYTDEEMISFVANDIVSFCIYRGHLVYHIC